MSIVLQLLVFFGPLGSVLHITAVDLWHMILVSAVAFIIPLATCEAHKWWGRRAY